MSKHVLFYYLAGIDTYSKSYFSAKINMLLLVSFLIFVSSLDSIESRYAIVFKEAFNCMSNSKINLVMHKNISGKMPTFGYVDILEDIEPNKNFQVGIETFHRGISDFNKIPSLNVQGTDLCVFLSTDILFVPVLRRMYDLAKFCPIPKAKHNVYKDTIVSKFRPYLPFGCWIIVTRITKQQSQPFACFNITVQSLPSMKSESYKCT